MTALTISLSHSRYIFLLLLLDAVTLSLYERVYHHDSSSITKVSAHSCRYTRRTFTINRFIAPINRGFIQGGETKTVYIPSRFPPHISNNAVANDGCLIFAGPEYIQSSHKCFSLRFTRLEQSRNLINQLAVLHRRFTVLRR